MRGAIGPSVGLFEAAAKEIKDILVQEGVAGMPLGLDMCEPGFLFALEKEGLRIRDGQQMMLAAREVKSHDEITLLNTAASMVDGVYQDITEALKPGVKESQIVALASKRLYEMGSDCVEAVNAIAGERCSPHPHNFTDRLIRPGDQAYFDIIHSFIGYRTCYYRTFSVGRSTPAQRDAYKKARNWMDGAISMLKPGVSTEKVAKMFPKCTEIGFETEMSAFGLNFCHGLGLGLHERPLISRLNSFIEPYELKAGMVFAVETFCPAKDGVSAARIEEDARRCKNNLSLSRPGIAGGKCLLNPALAGSARGAWATRWPAGSPRAARTSWSGTAPRKRPARWRSTARRWPTRSPSSPRATSCSAWCPRTRT
jgi:Xaa-Pro dipeptidase